MRRLDSGGKWNHSQTMLEWFRKNPLIAAIGVALLLVAAVVAYALAPRAPKAPVEAARIARAGGFVKAPPFFVSIEALDAAKAQGFTHFLVPVNLTGDKRVVCIPGWGWAAQQLFNLPQGAKPLSYDEFLTRPVSTPTRPCTLETLAGWLKANKDAVVVLSFQDRMPEVLQQVALAVPDHAGRIVPLLFAPQQVKKARSLGYERAMLALGRFFNRENTNAVLQFAKKGEFSGVFMPQSFASRKQLMAGLDKQGVPVYAVDAKNCEQFRGLLALGVDEIVTDSLTPAACPRAQKQ